MKVSLIWFAALATIIFGAAFGQGQLVKSIDRESLQFFAADATALDASQIEVQIENLASGRKIQEITRIFANDQFVGSDIKNLSYVRIGGLYINESNTILAKGYVLDNETLEDIHFINDEADT